MRDEQNQERQQVWQLRQGRQARVLMRPEDLRAARELFRENDPAGAIVALVFFLVVVILIGMGVL